MRKFFNLLLCGLLCVAIVGVKAETINLSSTYSNGASGPGWSFTGSVFSINGDVIIEGTTNTYRINVAGDVNITLNGASITSNANCAFDIAGGATVNLTISGTNTLHSGANYAGISVPSGATLIINGDDDSFLDVQGGTNTSTNNRGGGAGIGGNGGQGNNTPGLMSGLIYINSGSGEITGGNGNGNNAGGGAGVGGGGGSGNNSTGGSFNPISIADPSAWTISEGKGINGAGALVGGGGGSGSVGSPLPNYNPNLSLTGITASLTPDTFDEGDQLTQSTLSITRNYEYSKDTPVADPFTLEITFSNYANNSVTFELDDGSIVTPVTPTDALSVGSYDLIIHYGGVTATIPVTISEIVVEYYTVTLSVQKDGADYTTHGKTFTLRDNVGTVIYTGTGADETITFSLVENGTYYIYNGTEYTGKSVTVSGADDNATLDYYTVKFDVADEGIANGSTITATYNSVGIANEDIVLGGSTLVITAIGQGAVHYTYAWTGQGTSGETSETLTIEGLSEPVEALCTVTGTGATVTLTVNLDDSAWTGHGKTFTLWDNDTGTGSEKYTGTTEADGTVTFSDVIDGTYYIYDGTEYTGKSVTVSGADANVTLDYYSEPDPDPETHIIINQVYGSGPLDDSGSISHSFIELYNPTNAAVSLAGWSLQLQNGDERTGDPNFVPATEWEKLDFTSEHVIAAKGYFLIRLALAAPTSARCILDRSDIDWTDSKVLSNRAYSVALVSNQTLLTQTITGPEMDDVIDLFGAYNTSQTDVPYNFETAPVRISKQIAARRISFTDTDNNEDDFEALDYRSSGISNNDLLEKGPRYSGGLAFGNGEPPVTPDLPDHLIINQAAGVGNNADGALSHSFVEIYNPTDSPISLEGLSLQYAPTGADWSVLKLTGGSIPAKHSYLVRANGSTTMTVDRTYTIYYADQNWGITISNDYFKFALVDGIAPLTIYNPTSIDGVIDLVGADNSVRVDFGEGDAPVVGGASKQRSVRRDNFKDTDNNAADFKSHHYGNISEEQIREYRPRSLNDGAWEAGDKSPLPTPPVSGTINFSSSAGVYATDFDLTLTSSVEGATIIYTFDGSDPNPDNFGNTGSIIDKMNRERLKDVSYIYDDANPIWIENRTNKPEIAVSEDWTTGPLAFNGTYNRPDPGTVNQGTVVKAQLFTADGQPLSPVYVNSYFVETDMAGRYGNAPVISLSVPRDYFFDIDFGIYVRGPWEKWNDYIYPDYRNNGQPLHPTYNFDQRGNEWERAAYVEVFDPASPGGIQNAVISQGIGIRINGGNSRHSAQKALRLYARSGSTNGLTVYNGASTFDYNFFKDAAKDNAGNPITDGFKRILLRASGNDINNTFMRHSLINVISAGTAVDVQAYRPSVAFLNGEFWGFYEMLERYDDEYLAQHYGGSNNNYDILENPSTMQIGPEQGTVESIAYFQGVVAAIDASITANGISSPEVYAKVLEYVDEASLIDINILLTYFGNADWVNKINEGKGRYGNNQQIWRYTGTSTNNPGQDGKYRWMLVDMDHSFDLSNGYGNEDLAGLSYAPWAKSITYAIDGDKRVTIQASSVDSAAHFNNYFFYVLMQNEAFKTKFVNRYMDLLNTKLSATAMQSALDGIVAGMKKLWEGGEQQHRWSYTADYGSWSGQVEAIKKSMQQRASTSLTPGTNSGILANDLVNYVEGSKQLATLTINNGSNGTIKLNGMNVDGASWSGQYFVGYEQTVEAIPNSGYQFVRFEITDDNYTRVFTNRISTFELTGATTVTAVFADAGTVIEPAGIIINQVYAGGPNDNSASVTHSFIELYNPTDQTVSLDGWSLQVQNGNGNGTEFPTATEWLKYDFDATDVMAPHTSYLIRLDEVSQSVARYAVVDYDISWTVADGGRLLSNRAYSVALVSNQTLLSKTITNDEMSGVVDLLGAKNTNANDVSLNYKVAPYNDMSKQKSVRRIDFKNEGNNLTDFTSIDYRLPTNGISEDEVAIYRPRWSGDGAWPEKVVEPAGIIINQVYAGGPNDNSASVTHSFIELYNPTDQTVSLDGWSLQVQNGNGNGTEFPLSTEWLKYDFDATDVMAPHTSYLIRLDEVSQATARYAVVDYDISWTVDDGGRLLSNRAYSVALVSNQTLLSKTITNDEMSGVVDLLGAKNTSANDVSLNYKIAPYNDMSKQKSVRRIDFKNEGNNLTDFTGIDYRASGISDNEVALYRPRWSGDGAWPKDQPPVVPGEGWLPDHVIINQAAGIGDVVNDSSPGAIQYSFVELYNPTDAAVDISGWSLQYAESGDTWAMLPLTGIIPAKHSYLVRANGASTAARLFIPDYDQDWTDYDPSIIISNRSYKIALVSNQDELTIGEPTAANGVIDLVGADNPNNYADFWEGTGAVGKMSKQQAVRRQNFVDYDQNWYDFVSADYRVNDLETNRPRTLDDGAWGEDLIPIPPPPVTDGTIEFNFTAGIYDSPFDLILTTGVTGATIRYTTDGSDPTSDSPEFPASLQIEKIMTDPQGIDKNLLLAWILGTTGPRNEITNPGYTREDMQPTFKGTVVKAQLFDQNGETKSDIYVNSYFVNENIAALFGNLPVISMSTPVDRLFSEEYGIYVKGTDGITDLFNFDQKGGEWERSVYFEMFDPAYGSNWEITPAVSQGLGLRIHGGASRHFPQKSLRFYARSGWISNNMDVKPQPVINGKNSVDYDLFNGQSEVTDGFKRFMLRSAGNDAANSFLRDAITSKLTDCFGTVETQGYRYAVLFINGEFWGLYQLLERYDDEYLAQHYGGSASNYRVLENPSPGHPNLEDNVQDAIDYFEGKVAIVNAIADMNTPQAYTTLIGIVDEKSLIDYVIMETLGGNLDWVGFSGEWDNEFGHFVYYGNNQRMWYYTGTNDGQPGHDGKFRWMIYDTDKTWGYRHGGEYDDPNYNTIDDALDDNLFFFNKLMQNDLFRANFVSSYLKALDECVTLDKMQTAVDQLAGEIDKAIVEQQKRWPYTLSHSDWLTEVQGIKSWMATRVDPNGAFVKAIKDYMPSDQTYNIVAYIGEDSTLPTDIDWTDLTPFQNAKPFDRVQLTGTASGSDLFITANVDVIPRNTMYFIDAGTTQDVIPSWVQNNSTTLYRHSNTEDAWDVNVGGSTEYDLIKNKLAQDYQVLFNEVSDQLFEGNWGVEPEGVLFPVARGVLYPGRVEGPDAARLMTGYVGFGEAPDPPSPTYIEYKLFLPAGDYKITTGHYCWWDPEYNDQHELVGGKPRTMQILFNDVAVTPLPFTFTNFGENDIKHDLPFTQGTDGTLSIKINTTAGDGATISFIGVEDVTQADWYKVTYVNWNDSILKVQRTRDGLPEVPAPNEPTRPLYKFAGWEKDEVNSTAENIIYKATYTEMADIITPTYHEVIFVDETPDLPTTVEVLMGSGTTVEKAVTWDTTPLDIAQAFETVILTGVPDDYDELTMTAIIEVIPRDLVYFIDAGTAQLYKDNDINQPIYPGTSWRDENGNANYENSTGFTVSTVYAPIVDKLAQDSRVLTNGVSSDQLFDGTWGLVPDAFQFPVLHLDQVNTKLASGYVGWDDRDEENYWDKNKYVEYQLYLPAGDYKITTGHYCWWDPMYGDPNNPGTPTGGFPRTMQIWFNDVKMGLPFEFSALGHNKVVTNDYTHLTDGLLSIKVEAIDGTDGATLSFIGVEFTGTDGVAGIVGGTEKHFAAYVDEKTSLPTTIDVMYRSGKTEPADIVWDDTYDFTQAKDYDAVQLTGAVDGYPHLTFSAIIEVIPRGLTYFIDAAQFAGADKPVFGGQTPIRCFVEPHDCVFPDTRIDEWKSIGTYSSPAYDAVSAQLLADGTPLLNDAPDKFYDGSNNGWGLNPLSYQFAVEMINMPVEKKFVSGYVGYDNNESFVDEVKYLEYSLYLPAGEYEITTGHFDWWGLHGSNLRAMNILFNDVPVGNTIEFTSFMDRAVVTNTFIQPSDDILNIKIESVYEEEPGGFKDGASLTFIGVQEMQKAVVTYTVTFDPDNGDTPDVVTVNDGETVTQPTDPFKVSNAFLGWYLDNDEFDFTTPIFGDIELKAKWCLYGDVDDDGVVNVRDATLLSRFVAGWPDYDWINMIAADVFPDNIIDVRDATVLSRHEAGWPDYAILPYDPTPSPSPAPLMRLMSKLSGGESTIHASNETGKVGDIVEVSISLANNPGITDMQLRVTYDTSVLKLVGVDDGSKLGQQIHTPNYALTPYRLTWWNPLSVTDFENDGVVAKLRFEILTEADNSPITITPTTINNQQILPVHFDVVNGSVTSQNATSVNNPVNNTGLRVYPNPVLRSSTLTIEGVSVGSLVEVYNLSGLCVYRTIAVESPTSLSLNIPAGIYLIRANNGEVKVVVK